MINFWLQNIGFVLSLVILVAYLTWAERKLLARFHHRIGPQELGIFGLLQPIADVLKLLIKEPLVPKNADTLLFLWAPMISLISAFTAWSVIPLFDREPFAPLGVLVWLAMSGLGVYGALLGGLASRSRYAFLGGVRAASQSLSYAISLGCSVLGVALLTGHLDMVEIVRAQRGGVQNWLIFPLAPLCLVQWLACLAETNRSPFDVAESESELVAGFHVEYSGMGFALYFLSEYINMLLHSVVMSLFYLGGWYSPFAVQSQSIWSQSFWLGLKVSFFLLAYVWMRASLPRFRYDQIMRLNWQYLVPGSLLWLLGCMLLIVSGLWTVKG